MAKKQSRAKPIDINQLNVVDQRILQVQIKRDIRLFDRFIMKHDKPENELKIYQLKAAAPIIYIMRDKIKATIKKWMIKTGNYTGQEIEEWSNPVYEWPDLTITAEQKAIMLEWRRKYKIKDRTDWENGIILTAAEKKKLDTYKQISILQPRQTGKSEVVVRVNNYLMPVIEYYRAGVFAPTEDQAKEFIFRRTRDYIEYHPAYAGRFKVLNALDLEFNPPNHEKAAGSGARFSASSASPTANIEGDTLDCAILDESQDITEFKVKKSIRYMLAATNGAMIKIGTVNTIKGHFWESTTKKGAAFWHQVIITPDIVAATRPDWAGFIENEIKQEGRHADVVRMSVFLEWMLEVGMFITESQWNSLTDPTADWITHKKTGLQYCVIDVAKTKDETIAKVVEIDLKRVIEGRHPMRVLNILTMQGVNYVDQFHTIKNWLDENYNVAAVGVDDTGGRGGIADQFAGTRYRVESFTYTRPSKSEWYTNLQTMINAQAQAVKEGRLHDRLIIIPGSEAAKEEKIYRDFEEQMLDLQKSYKNSYLVVHHPAIDGAKDDYADTLMMAAWMASKVAYDMDDYLNEIKKVKETEAGKLDTSKDIETSRRKRNKINMADIDDDLLLLQRMGGGLESSDL